jgi:hypothetical protein
MAGRSVRDTARRGSPPTSPSVSIVVEAMTLDVTPVRINGLRKPVSNLTGVVSTK